MNYDEMIAVLQAAKEGKQIACKRKDHPYAPWFPIEKDDCGKEWNFQVCNYRVKPEPREWILVEDSLEHCAKYAWAVKPGHTIKVREVLE